MIVKTSAPINRGHMDCLIMLVVVCDVIAALYGARFEQKSHGIRTELAAHSVGTPFTVDSRAMCASACSYQICDLIYYSAATNSCTIYNAYMSDDQPALEGLYGKTGAIDKKPCPALYSPSYGSVSSQGTSYGNTATYTCNLGYKFGTGSSTRTCGANGVWSGNTPTCVVSWRPVGHIKVTNGGIYGSWGNNEYCPFGSYAYGYDLKIEPDQQWGDDSVLNGVKLYCRTQTGSDTGTITSATERFGPWIGSNACDPNDFLTGFALQVEGDQGGGDDTMANFVKMKCRNFAGTSTSSIMFISPGQGPYGNYGYWSSECGANTAVCGIRTKVEVYQGDGDDTTLNDLILYCCA